MAECSGCMFTVVSQGRRHDFGIGGAESEVGRKMCALARAQFLDHTRTHQYVKHAHLSRISAISLY